MFWEWVANNWWWLSFVIVFILEQVAKAIPGETDNSIIKQIIYVIELISNGITPNKKKNGGVYESKIYENEEVKPYIAKIADRFAEQAKNRLFKNKKQK